MKNNKYVVDLKVVEENLNTFFSKVENILEKASDGECYIWIKVEPHDLALIAKISEDKKQIFYYNQDGTALTQYDFISKMQYTMTNLSHFIFKYNVAMIKNDIKVCHLRIDNFTTDEFYKEDYGENGNVFYYNDFQDELDNMDEDTLFNLYEENQKNIEEEIIRIYKNRNNFAAKLKWFNLTIDKIAILFDGIFDSTFMGTNDQIYIIDDSGGIIFCEDI